VRKSAYGLLTIINDILDFSKIEAGKLFIDNNPFKLNELAEETMDLLAVKAYEKNLEMLFSTDLQLRAFQRRRHPHTAGAGEPGGNAIKFTEAGEIFVQVRRAGDSYRLDGKNTLISSCR